MLVLVHRPLTGPLVWHPDAGELARRGVHATVPEVADHPSGGGPYWQQHARSVARSLRGVPPDRGIVLIGHSGAGPLLPAIRDASGRPVLGYLFVDAGIPEDGATRLEQIRREAPGWSDELEENLRGGGRFPEWTDHDLREAIPQDGLRRGVIQELRPRPLAFFEEAIPVFEGWPDAPCGYLKLSGAYDVVAERASKEGWPVRTIEGNHFSMLVEPAGVAEEILALLQEMSVPTR